jgi:hypothetical protein
METIAYDYHGSRYLLALNINTKSNIFAPTGLTLPH